MSIFLQNLAMVLFGAKPHNVEAIFSLPTIMVGGVSLPLNVLLTIAIGVVIMLGMQLFVKGTKLGKAMRAVPQDKDASTLMESTSTESLHSPSASVPPWRRWRR